MLALVQARHRARQGRCALIKWRPDVEAVLDADRPASEVYFRDPATLTEGFPLLPVAALAMEPLLALGDVPGAVVFALLKVLLAGWMLASALELGAPEGRGRRAWPPWAVLLVVALSARVLLSDVSHGNVNIPVGATVVAAAVLWARGHDLAAGLLAGVGTVLKVTPGLLFVYFCWKRSGRAALGWLAGAVGFALIVPTPFLGFERNLELSAAWWGQMIEPFLRGAPVTRVQTEQVNQSLLGVLARWTTDSIAIDGEPPESIHRVALSPTAFRALYLAASLGVVAALARCIRRDRDRRVPRVLGEFALLALAMLMLSERSWKHHWVLLMLPVAYLAAHAVRWPPPDPSNARAARDLRRAALVGLVASAALHGLTGSGVLGDRGSDLAEAWGAFLLGGLVLFATTGWILRRTALTSGPGRGQ